MVKYTKKLSIGPVTLVDGENALVGVTFTGGGEFSCRRALTPAIEKGFRQIEEYLTHKRMIFTVDYNLPREEEFARSVLRIVQSFPYGETYPIECITQGLGLPLNGLTRAEIIDVLEGNPLPILIPCHRVEDSGIRRAYGEDIRRRLLELERTPPEI